MFAERFFKPRRIRSPRTLCAIDIGTTKVCALIGSQNEEGALEVLGVGSCRSRGVIRGEVVDMDQTVNALCKSIGQAERLAGITSSRAIIGIAGDHIQSLNVEAMTEVKHSERGVVERDRDRVIRKARKSVALPADREIIHAVAQAFSLNGKMWGGNPIGLSASHLGVKMHLILASISSGRNIVRCVKRAGMGVRDVVLQSLASSANILSPHEKELGVLMLDVGGGTSDYALFKDGCVQMTGEIPLAGNVITNDIQIVWKVSEHDAERLKKKLGSALPMSLDGEEMVDLPSLHPNRPSEQRKRRELAEIIEARIEEIFLMAREKIERTTTLADCHAGVVLTGGTSMLEGISEVAERVFDAKCRVGFPQGIDGMTGVLASPIYSTGVGLLNFGESEERNSFAIRTGLWGRLWQGCIDVYA